MPRNLDLDIFEWTHPDMSTPLQVSIGFDSDWRYDASAHRDYEVISPYIEAVYLGNVDVMPLMCMGDLSQALKDYKESRE